jgi:hypothetical protein
MYIQHTCHWHSSLILELLRLPGMGLVYQPSSVAVAASRLDAVGRGLTTGTGQCRPQESAVVV